jgi:hypothetical protein
MASYHQPPTERMKKAYAIAQLYLSAHIKAVESLGLPRGLQMMIWKEMHWTAPDMEMVGKTIEEARRELSMVGKQTYLALASLQVRAKGWMLDDLVAVQILVHISPRQIARASLRLRDNSGLIFAAARDHPQALLCASARLRSNKTFVLRVVAKFEGCFPYASATLRSDIDVVKTAIQRSRKNVLRYASYNIRNDREFAIWAFSACSEVELISFTEIIRDDNEVAMLAVKNRPDNLQSVSTRLKNDRALVVRAISADPLCLSYASLELKDDAEVVLMAVYNNPRALKEASKRLRNSIPFLSKCIEAHAGSWRYIGYFMRREMLRGRTDEDDLCEFGS